MSDMLWWQNMIHVFFLVTNIYNVANFLSASDLTNDVHRKIFEEIRTSNLQIYKFILQGSESTSQEIHNDFPTTPPPRPIDPPSPPFPECSDTNDTVFWPKTAPGESAKSIPLCLDEDMKILTRKCRHEEGWEPAPQCSSTQKEIQPCPTNLEHIYDNYCYTIINNTQFPPKCPYPDTIEWDEYIDLNLTDRPIWMPVIREDDETYGIDIMRFTEHTKYKLPFEICTTSCLSYFYSDTFMDKKCLIYHNRTHIEAVNCNDSYSAVCAYHILSNRNTSICTQAYPEKSCKQSRYDADSSCFCEASDQDQEEIAEFAEFLLPYQNLLYNSLENWCLMGLENNKDKTSEHFVWSSSNISVNYTYWDTNEDINFEHRYGAISSKGWTLQSNQNADCILYQIPPRTDSGSLRLETVEDGFKLEIHNYSNFLYDKDGHPLVYCFTDADATSLVFRIHDFSKSKLNDTEYILKFSSLNEAGPGNYWCEAFLYSQLARIKSETKPIKTNKAEFVVIYKLKNYEEMLSSNPLTAESLSTLQNLLKNEIYNTSFVPRIFKINDINERDKELILTFHLTSAYNITENIFYGLKHVVKFQKIFEFIDFRSVHYCPLITTIQADGQTVTWPDTTIGEKSDPENGFCVSEDAEPVHKICSGNFIDGAYWSETGGNCTFYASSNVTKSLVAITECSGVCSSQLNNLLEITNTYTAYTTLDLVLTTVFLANIADNQPSIKIFAEIINNLMMVPRPVLLSSQLNFKATDKLLHLIDAILEDGEFQEHKTENFMIRSINIKESTVYGVFLHNCSTQLNDCELVLVNNASYLDNGILFHSLESPVAAIILSPELYDQIINYSTKNSTYIPKLTISIYSGPQLFVDFDTLQSSKTIFGVLLPDFPEENFNGPLLIYYFNATEKDILQYNCSYWQFDEAIYGSWTVEATENNDTAIVCKYYHVTNFGITTMKNETSKSAITSDIQGLNAHNQQIHANGENIHNGIHFCPSYTIDNETTCMFQVHEFYSLNKTSNAKNDNNYRDLFMAPGIKPVTNSSAVGMFHNIRNIGESYTFDEDSNLISMNVLLRNMEIISSKKENDIYQKDFESFESTYTEWTFDQSIFTRKEFPFGSSFFCPRFYNKPESIRVHNLEIHELKTIIDNFMGHQLKNVDLNVAKLANLLSQSFNKFKKDIVQDSISALAEILNLLTKIPKDIMFQAQNKVHLTDKILHSIDDILFDFNSTIQFKNDKIIIIALSKKDIHNFWGFYVRKDKEVVYIDNNTNPEEEFDTANIELVVLISRQLRQQIERRQTRVIFVLFYTDTYFPDSKYYVELPVIEILFPDLKEHLEADFKISYRSSHNSKQPKQCSYWDHKVVDNVVVKVGQWRTEFPAHKDGQWVTCTFNHATHFALITFEQDITTDLEYILSSNLTAREKLKQVDFITKNSYHNLIPLDIFLISQIIGDSITEDAMVELVSGIISNLFNVPRSVLKKSQEFHTATDILLHNVDSMAEILDDAFINIHNFSLIVKDLTAANLTGIVLKNCGEFTCNIDQLQNLINISEYTNDETISAMLIFDEKLLNQIRNLGSNSKVVISIYYSDALFNELDSEKKTTKVFGVVFPGLKASLDGLISVIHNVGKTTNSNIQCAYWHYKANPHGNVDNATRGRWEAEVSMTGKIQIPICNFSHVTHFSMLLADDDDFLNSLLLDTLTNVGCFLSLIGITIIVLTAVFFKRWRQNTGNKILGNFSIAISIKIVMLYVSDYVKNNRGGISCTISGMVLHYATLSECAWMLSIAILQFKRFVEVLGGPPNHALIKALICGWIFPVIPVVCVILIDPDNYQRSHVGICYPSELGLYLGVWLPLIMIVSINCIIFIFIMYHVFHKKAEYVDNTNHEVIFQWRLALLLFFMLGLTWLFGFLGEIKGDTLFIYVFNITASSQGFIMFLFFIVFNKSTRAMYLHFTKQFFLTKSIPKIWSAKPPRKN